MLGGTINEEQIHNFIQQLEQGTAKCVSDGSARAGATATAFTTIPDDDNEPAFQGSFRIPGRYEEQDSYRSELAGLLGILLTVNMFCIIHSV